MLLYGRFSFKLSEIKMCKELRSTVGTASKDGCEGDKIFWFQVFVFSKSAICLFRSKKKESCLPSSPRRDRPFSQSFNS